MMLRTSCAERPHRSCGRWTRVVRSTKHIRHYIH